MPTKIAMARARENGDVDTMGAVEEVKPTGRVGGRWTSWSR